MKKTTIEIEIDNLLAEIKRDETRERRRIAAKAKRAADNYLVRFVPGTVTG